MSDGSTAVTRFRSGARRAVVAALFTVAVPLSTWSGDARADSTPIDELEGLPLPAPERTADAAEETGAEEQSRPEENPFPMPMLDTGLWTNGAVRDPVRPVMYATISSDDPTHPSSIASIDPQTGAVLATTPLPGDPNAIAIADDGSALYVGLDVIGRLQQIVLPSMTPGWSHDFPSSGNLFGTPAPTDIEVAPGDPDLVLVARGDAGVSAFRAGTLLAATAHPTFAIDHIVFGASAGVVYAYHPWTTAHYFAELKVDAGGVTIARAQAGAIGFSFGDIAFFDGKIHTGRGEVYDTATWPPTKVGGFEAIPFSGPRRSFSIDPAGGFVTFVEDLDRVVVHDLSTRQVIEQWALPNNTFASRSSLVTVAEDVLAFVPGFAGSQTLKLFFPAVLRYANGEYTALTPSRVLDTRSGHGTGGVVGPLGPGFAQVVQITGRGGVPNTGVKAVVMNVTAVAPTEVTYLSVYPTGIPLPEISNLNSAPGRNRPNLVTVPVGPDGRVVVYNAFGSTHVLFDVAGYYASSDGPAGSRLRAIDPVRLADTRHGSGGIGLGTLGPGEQRTITTTGTPGGAPVGASAVVLNVTVTDTTGHSFLTVSPSDVERPPTSNLNFLPGDTVANQVIVRVPADGSIDIFNAVGRAHVIVDLVAYYEPGGDRQRGRFITTTPFRAFDTRSDPIFPPPGDLWDGDVMTWGQVNEAFSAFAANVTVTGTTGAGYVVTYPHPGLPSSGNPPETSTVNYGPNDTVANHAIIRTGPFLGFLNRLGRTHLIMDVFGAFA